MEHDLCEQVARGPIYETRADDWRGGPIRKDLSKRRCIFHNNKPYNVSSQTSDPALPLTKGNTNTPGPTSGS